jgi:hypothetical protein
MYSICFQSSNEDFLINKFLVFSNILLYFNCSYLKEAKNEIKYKNQKKVKKYKIQS